MKNQKMKKPLIKALVLLAVCASLLSCFVISSSADTTAIENPTILSGYHFVSPSFGQYTFNAYGRFTVHDEPYTFTRLLIEPNYVGGQFTSLRVVYFLNDGTSFNAGMVLANGSTSFTEGWDLIYCESLLVPSADYFVPCFQVGLSYHILSVPPVYEVINGDFLWVNASQNYDIVYFESINIVENDVIGGYDLRYGSNVALNSVMNRPYEGNLYFTCLDFAFCTDASVQKLVNQHIVPVVRSSASYNEGYYEGFADGRVSGYDEGFSAGEDYGYELGFTDGVNSVEDPEDNYQIIYDEGYSSGYSIGYTEGYDDGLSDGREEGFDEGYSQGSNSANTPSFGQNLLGDTLSVPIEALNSFTIYVSPSGFEVTLGLVLGGCITLTLLLAFLKMFAGG